MPLNKSTGNMYEFITLTWNTIKGECPHGCSYCYMKRWGKQPPLHFDEKELKTKLGLETNVTVVPFKERLTKTREGNYDIVLNTWSPKYDDSLSYLERWKKEDM